MAFSPSPPKGSKAVTKTRMTLTYAVVIFSRSFSVSRFLRSNFSGMVLKIPGEGRIREGCAGGCSNSLPCCGQRWVKFGKPSKIFGALPFPALGFSAERTVMKFGLRKVNLKSSLKARTTGRVKRSIKRSVNPLYGKRGWGGSTIPRRPPITRCITRPALALAMRCVNSLNKALGSLDKVRALHLK